MAMEGQQIWTQNDHYMQDSKQKLLDQLTSRLYSDVGSANENLLLQAIQRSPGLTTLGISQQDLRQLLANKQQAAQGKADAALLDKIAGTLAYFKLSSKRVYDAVPMHIKHYLLRRYCEELEQLPLQLPANGVSAADDSGFGNDCNRLQDKDVKKQQMTVSTAADPLTGDEVTVHPLKHLLTRLPFNVAELMEEEGSVRERRAHLQKQQKQLLNVRHILQVF
jgi:hypothetical protein